MPRTCTTVLALLMLSSSTYAQNQKLFFQPPTYTGHGQMVTADFNGDGKPDLISSDGTVQLGNGDGTFKTGTPWSVPGQNYSAFLASGDFNRDGKPDLVVSFGTSLYVLLGNGDGTFQPAIPTNIGTGLGPILVADVNGDGKPDVLGNGAGGLMIFLGKGDGTFALGATYPPVSNIANTVVTVGDFNGDGKLDIVMASFTSNGTAPGAIEVFLGNGDGTFQSPVISTGVNFPGAGVAGDFNGDGKLDLALADTSTGQTFILLGNGNATFQAPGSPLPAAGALAGADLNGDNKLDLLVEGAPITGIFLGKGDGTFTLKDNYAEVSGEKGSFAIADFNGDGKIDVAAGSVVLLGNGDGTFQGNVAVPINNACGLQVGVTGDFNGDGNPDVALLSNNGVCILLGDGTGKFSLAHSYTLPLPSFSIATADLNGDGKLDLIMVTVDPITQDWSLDVLLGNGDGSFGASTAFAQGVPIASPFPIPVTVADLNGDKKPDVVVLNQQSSELSVLLGKGDGTFVAAANYFAGSRPNSFVVADFNNDGIPDFAVASDAGLGILLGKGDGTFQSATFSTPSLGLLATADLNRDGNADLIGAGGTLQVFLGNGDGTFTVLPSTGQLAGSSVSVVDVNGDGKLDLVQLLEPSVPFPSLNPGVQVLLGNGDGTFANATTVLHAVALKFCCLFGYLALVADFNHDNRPDVAVTISGSGSGGITTVLNTAQPPASDFLLSASSLPPTLVKPGSSATSTVTLTPISGFTGSVSLSCAGLPSGANCSFAPASVSGSGTSALTISTASSTPIASYPVIITGSSSSLMHSVTITLVVATSAGVTRASLAPNSLTFALQPTGATSAPQAVQLTNIGAATLNITGISITGANAGDFNQTNTCVSASPLAAGASCQISATFTPTGLGASTAAISVNDNATGSPQLVALNGTTPDFSLSAGSTATATVSPGQTATYTISVAPSGGFNQSVMFTCTGAPALTTCAVSPNPLSQNGTSAAMATVTVTTTAPSHGFAPPFEFDARWKVNHGPRLFMLGVLGMLIIASLLVWHRNRRTRWAPLVTLTVLLCMGITITSCGGGSSPSSTGSPGTQAGTYTITVSGSPALSSSTSTHTATLTLVVQ